MCIMYPCASVRFARVDVHCWIMRTYRSHRPQQQNADAFQQNLLKNLLTIVATA